MPANSIRLVAKRPLVYAENGVLQGPPLITIHGYLSSRLEEQLLDASAKRRNLRVIAPHRNGIGASDYTPNRRVLDRPEVIETLANALGIEHFHLIGVSGGGPYALACAHRINHRIEGLALVCPLDPLKHVPLRRVIRWCSRCAVATMRSAPDFTQLLYRQLTPVLARKHMDPVKH